MPLDEKVREEGAMCLVQDILECYHQLSKSSDLYPAPCVNNIFARLVQSCCQIVDDSIVEKVMTDPRISVIIAPLRTLCSHGEYQLELYWTERILSESTQDGVNARLSQFTYYQNYLDLTQLETNAVASVNKGTRPRKFAVLGSGPLPLTSICILRSHKIKEEGVTVHNFDRDPQAISISLELCCKLGYDSSDVHFQVLDVMSDRCDLLGVDVVYLASLVGITGDQKQRAISNIVKQMRAGALLVIRSAHSLRGLLYPTVQITADLISLGLRPLLVVHPYSDVVNSVIICQVDFSTPSSLNRTSHAITNRTKRSSTAKMSSSGAGYDGNGVY